MNYQTTADVYSYYSKDFNIICERTAPGAYSTHTLSVVLPDGTLHYRSEPMETSNLGHELNRLKMRMWINPQIMQKFEMKTKTGNYVRV